jgi:hypothetical protein
MSKNERAPPLCERCGGARDLGLRKNHELHQFDIPNSLFVRWARLPRPRGRVGNGSLGGVRHRMLERAGNSSRDRQGAELGAQRLPS